MPTIETPTDPSSGSVSPAVAARPVPGPRGLELVRTVCAMRRDALGTFTELIARYGDAISLPVGRLDLALLNHPEQVAHVLQTRAQRYEKSPSYRELELVLGKGLLTSEGSFWKRQRRLAQPAFKRRVLAPFAPLVAELTEGMLARWASAPGPFDLAAETMRLALQVAGHTLFSADLTSEADDLGRALAVALPFVQHRTEAVFNWPMALPLPSHLRFRRALARLDQVALELIERRQAGDEASAPRDLLSMLVFARDPETGARMDARQVRDEVMTFLLAGHETTANALAFTLYLLARHPEVEEAVRAEATAVLGERAPAADDLARLELTRRVVLEALRLYPPAWVIERAAIEDDEVGGLAIPRGTIVMLCAYTTHRHPELWADPERFDPDRFLPERAASRPRCAYFPFGAGQRQCIGEDFALLELLTVVPLVVRRFRLRLPADHRLELEPGVTLRPRGGIPVTAEPRTGGAR